MQQCSRLLESKEQKGVHHQHADNLILKLNSEATFLPTAEAQMQKPRTSSVKQSQPG